jgi:hypothetical protein
MQGVPQERLSKTFMAMKWHGEVEQMASWDKLGDAAAALSADGASVYLDVLSSSMESIASHIAEDLVLKYFLNMKSLDCGCTLAKSPARQSFHDVLAAFDVDGYEPAFGEDLMSAIGCARKLNDPENAERHELQDLVDKCESDMAGRVSPKETSLYTHILKHDLGKLLIVGARKYLDNTVHLQDLAANKKELDEVVCSIVTLLGAGCTETEKFAHLLEEWEGYHLRIAESEGKTKKEKAKLQTAMKAALADTLVDSVATALKKQIASAWESAFDWCLGKHVEGVIPEFGSGAARVVLDIFKDYIGTSVKDQDVEAFEHSAHLCRFVCEQLRPDASAEVLPSDTNVDGVVKLIAERDVFQNYPESRMELAEALATGKPISTLWSQVGADWKHLYQAFAANIAQRQMEATSKLQGDVKAAVAHMEADRSEDALTCVKSARKLLPTVSDSVREYFDELATAVQIAAEIQRAMARSKGPQTPFTTSVERDVKSKTDEATAESAHLQAVLDVWPPELSQDSQPVFRSVQDFLAERIAQGEASSVARHAKAGDAAIARSRAALDAAPDPSVDEKAFLKHMKANGTKINALSKACIQATAKLTEETIAAACSCEKDALTLISIYTLLTMIRNPAIEEEASVTARTQLMSVVDVFKGDDPLPCLPTFLEEADAILRGSSGSQGSGPSSKAAKKSK